MTNLLIFIDTDTSNKRHVLRLYSKSGLVIFIFQSALIAKSQGIVVSITFVLDDFHTIFNNLWQQHFENLQGNPPKITREPITRIISKQLDIKLGPFTQEELDSVLRKIKNRKAAGLDEIPPEVWKTRQFDDILLRHCNAVYNQHPIDRWMKGCILPFPKKRGLGLAKNYRGITLISIAAKIYNALLRNRIEPKIDNILRKNQNGFRRNRSTTSQILTIRRILESVRAKNQQATLIFVDFTPAFDSIHRGKMEQILLVYGIPKEIASSNNDSL